MKKIKILIIAIIYILIMAVFVRYNSKDLASKSFEKTFEGYMFNNDYSEKAEVTFKGEVFDPWIGQTSYKGVMIIEGKEYNMYSFRNADYFDDMIFIRLIPNLKIKGQGKVYMDTDEKMSKVTLTIYDEKGKSKMFFIGPVDDTDNLLEAFMTFKRGD